MIREVFFYKTTKGKSLIDEFLDDLSAKQASNIFRLLCFFDEGKLVVIAHAFQKKTQKTPRQAIELAEQQKKEYLQRKKK